MAKRLLRGVALVALVSALAGGPSESLAQDGDDFLYGFNVNASLGYAVPNTDEYGNAFYFRFGGGYSFTEMIALDLSVGRFSSEVKHEMGAPPANTIADGDLTVIPIVLNAQIRFPVPQFFGTFYAMAGAGYYLIDYSWSGDSDTYFSEVEALYGLPVQEISDSFGFNLGAGFDYPLGMHMVLNLEGQYVFLSPEAKGDWRDPVTGEHYLFDTDLDLNTWLFSAGVRYLF